MTVAGGSPLPLEGKRVAVTRPLPQGRALARRLEELGAEPLLLPAVEIVPPLDQRPLEDAARRARAYDGIVFTSPNSVEAFVRCFKNQGLAISTLDGVAIAAVGTATAGAARSYGFSVATMPDAFDSESLSAALIRQGAAGKRLLVPRSSLGRPVLVERLRGAGARVDEVVAYRTLHKVIKADRLREIHRRGLDALTFTSPSTAISFARSAAAAGLETLLATPAFCIGPVTQKAALEQGYRVVGVGSPYTVEGLIQSLVSRFRTGE